MARPKRRVAQHVMEDESEGVLRNSLPKEWVTRRYRPDYGIDFAVEVFEYADEQRTIAETLGETFFIQLKSAAKTTINTVRVHSRGNVAKGPPVADKTKFLDIEVIKYEIDTPELFTVETMGNGVPVVLILATLDSNRLFFVCLNDLIDKVLVPNDPDYGKNADKTIYIPVRNEITSDPTSLTALRFYAKRAKFYSCFVLFEYQRNELNYARHGDKTTTAELILHFIRILDRLDIWDRSEMWRIVGDYRKQLDRWLMKYAERGLTPDLLDDALRLWTGLVSLAHNYEELCREWFLPTHFAQFLSYPDLPTDNTHF
jgi:hypothetical protein